MSEPRVRVTVGAADVVGVLHLPNRSNWGPGPWPCVVACHGMGASKDSDKYLLLGRELPAAGLALARFDFRGSGESGGRHEDATIETRVADLEGVLDHLARALYRFLQEQAATATRRSVPEPGSALLPV